MFGDDEIYLGRIHPKDAQILKELTEPRNWDYGRFKRVMVALGIVGGGQAIPAPNRPESIHLQGLRPFVDGLVAKTTQGQDEHAQPVFADTEKKSLVMGRITRGSGDSVRLDVKKAPGREPHQRLIGSVHTHPTATGRELSHGLSGQDYRTLLSDPNQQFMMITWGDENKLLILKTSATPNNLKPAQVNARVKTCEEEFLQSGTAYSMSSVVEFNKTVCTEFGLTMYIADKQSRDLFNRVNVV